jgi:hypothetical protein
MWQDIAAQKLSSLRHDSPQAALGVKNIWLEYCLNS